MRTPRPGGYLPVQIGVRLTPRLKAYLDRRADEEEMCVSTLVRTLIEREAKRDLQQTIEVQGDV
jgi:hypothetical protein